MAVNISIDLHDATYADLVALVDAARVAGVDPHAQLQLEDSTLQIAVDTPVQQRRSHAGTEIRPVGGEQSSAPSALPQLGDAAIRSVVDILTGRQDPPRSR